MIPIPLKDFPFWEHGIPPPDKPKICWSANMKETFLLLIEDGMLAEAEFLKAYGVSEEELLEWKEAFCRAGKRGLRVTKRKRR